MVFAPEAQAEVPATSPFAAPCNTCGGTFSDEAAPKFAGAPVNTNPFVPSNVSDSAHAVPLAIVAAGWLFRIFSPRMQGAGPSSDITDDPIYAPGCEVLF